MDKLRFSNPREALAENFVKANLVKLETAQAQEKHTKLKGVVVDNGKQQSTEVLIDKDERLFDAQCTCDFYIRNKLFKGPCEHMLAVRKAHTNRLGGK